jgi:thymidine phosphorylase
VAGITDGSVTDAQISAFAMAVFFNGLDGRRDRGADACHARFRRRARLVGIDKPICDKHSTGGVGDNVSLMLAPIAAACGLAMCR